jgi:hypothetical protein
MAADANALAVELAGGVSTSRALAAFDSLPAVSLTGMAGRWVGSEIPTGHPLDGLLGAYGWHGKRFSADNEADPLIFARGATMFHVKPSLVPLGLAVKLPRLVRHRAVVVLGRLLLPLLSTRRPQARLRRVDYRGVSTATMIYDAQPINDHFRRLDADTLLGAMDLRGMPEPFFFLLRREPA